MSISVVLADDDPLMRLGLRAAIESQEDLQVIGEASTGREAVVMAAESSPDVVLMDVRMPEMDGIEATSQIVRSGVASKVVVMTTFDLDEYVYAALRAGASGFLLKNTPPSDMFSGLRAVANGDAVIAPRVTRRLIDNFSSHFPSPGAGGTPDGFHLLTDREQEVLLQVATGSTNAEIADRLFVAEGTIKTHVGRILTKLRLRDRVQIVVYAYENDLVQPGNDPEVPG